MAFVRSPKYYLLSGAKELIKVLLDEWEDRCFTWLYQNPEQLTPSVYLPFTLGITDSASIPPLECLRDMAMNLL